MDAALSTQKEWVQLPSAPLAESCERAAGRSPEWNPVSNNGLSPDPFARCLAECGQAMSRRPKSQRGGISALSRARMLAATWPPRLRGNFGETFWVSTPGPERGCVSPKRMCRHERWPSILPRGSLGLWWVSQLWSCRRLETGWCCNRHGVRIFCPPLEV